MKVIKMLAIPFVAALFLTACNAGKLNDKAAATADAFYKDLQQKNYDAALNQCSDRAFVDDTKEQWKKIFEKNTGLLGDLKSFTKTSGFNVEASTNNGVSVTMAFDVQYQYGKSQDSIYFTKDKDGNMKIFRYTWKHKDGAYQLASEKSEKEAAQYIDDIKAGNYDAAVSFCSDEALKTTPKPDWIAFLQHAGEKLGPISNYSILKDSTEYNIAANGESGKGNYYDVYIQSDRGGNKVKEKIIFFQKNYDEPVKLAGHSFE